MNVSWIAIVTASNKARNNCNHVVIAGVTSVEPSGASFPLLRCSGSATIKRTLSGVLNAPSHPWRTGVASRKVTPKMGSFY